MKSNLAFKRIPEDSPEKTWAQLFSKANIRDVFYQHIHPKGGQGVDRISVLQFSKMFDEQAAIINKKCIAGTYKFSPYLEQLQSKGKSKAPRIISIATVRDKIVLKILTEFIHIYFDEYLAKDLPNTVIKKIKKELSENSLELGYIKLDLENFYGSIPHDELVAKLRNHVNYLPFISLVKRAICNPTLASGYSLAQKKLAKNLIGIPQGLSISNIMAEIYIEPFDKEIRNLSKSYFRFVDDIFILCELGKAEPIWKLIKKVSENLKLSISKDKSTPENSAQQVSLGFEFLGYSFKNKKISVREASKKKFLHSVIGKISRYKHERVKDDGRDLNLKKSVFIEDLNERITGAIDKNRRYGWVFFFSEIDDIPLLHEIDMVVGRVLSRIQGFTKEDLKKIKRVSRAHYEANHSPKRGYIHNYNSYETIAQKMKYLGDRGYLKKEGKYTEEQIHQMFEKAKANNLLKLERDVGILS